MTTLITASFVTCETRWVRFQLSDGSFARLVEMVMPADRSATGPPVHAHRIGPGAR